MRNINERIADLRKRLDELEKQQSKGRLFVPEYFYWYIAWNGEIAMTDLNSSHDFDALATGNCYPTKEAAEQVVLNRKIHRFLREQTNFVADWSALTDKWSIKFDHESNDFVTDEESVYQRPNIVYFESSFNAKSAAQAAIAKFGLEAFEDYLRGSIV